MISSDYNIVKTWIHRHAFSYYRFSQEEQLMVKRCLFLSKSRSAIWFDMEGNKIVLVSGTKL